MANRRLFTIRSKWRGRKMGIKQTKKEIEQLKDQLKATKSTNDSHLLKMALVMIILAVIAGIVYGRIQLW